MDRKDYRKILRDFSEEYPVGKVSEIEDFFDFVNHLRYIVDRTVYHYIADFALDSAVLGTSYGRDEKTKFVFITRESGTWLYEKSYDDFLNEKENHQSFRAMKYNYGEDFCAFEIWFDAHNGRFTIERKF